MGEFDADLVRSAGNWGMSGSKFEEELAKIGIELLGCHDLDRNHPCTTKWAGVPSSSPRSGGTSSSGCDDDDLNSPCTKKLAASTAILHWPLRCAIFPMVIAVRSLLYRWEVN